MGGRGDRHRPLRRAGWAGEAPSHTSLAQEIDTYLAAAEPGKADDTFRVFWKGGLSGETADKTFAFKLGGRFMLDSYWKSSDDFGDDEEIVGDGVGFRRLRLESAGTIYRNVEFLVQVELAKSEVEIKDVFLEIQDVPFVGMIRVGHFKEPIGLEELTSSKSINFMERSVPTNCFAPSHNVGLAVGDSAFEKHMTWILGIFRDTDANGTQVEDGGYQLTLRVTGLLLENKDKGTLLHLGFSFSARDPEDNEYRVRARPNTGFGDRLVDTGTLTVDGVNILGFEAAFVWNSLRVQGEFFLADLSDAFDDGSPLGDATLSGFYVMAAFWLTGETHSYKSGVFGSPSPKKNFLRGSGWGAWEIAVRFDSVDLNDGLVAGGEMTTITGGLNWHLNPNTRILFNVVFADIDAVGELTIFQTRFQLAW
ncbi:MAG: hypothetical protein HC813_00160 [Planctomycetes bacterium]|nr:hypothetical protein [Planctomycetota bacterium]